MSLRLGDIAPNFQQASSAGEIDFYQFLGDSWGVLFSHPADYTPVCTTENTTVNFPIIADQDRKVSELYGFIHPNASETLTVRSLVIIDPNKKVRLIITYPASTGRNFNEILRVVDSLQLTDKHKVATPANWQQGEDVVIVPSLKDEEEIKQRFPKGYTAVKSYLRLTPQPERG